MQGIAIQGGDGTTFIKGWNITTFMGLEELKRDTRVWTMGAFKIKEGPKYHETVFLTNDKDEPLLEPCNMVIGAFGGKPIPKGTSAEAIVAELNKYIGKKCSILLVKQPNKENKMYFKVYKDDYDVNIIMPEAHAGTEYGGAVQTAAPKQKEESVDPNDIGF